MGKDESKSGDKKKKKDKCRNTIYSIKGEEFVLLSTIMSVQLAQGKSVEEIRFLSNLAYQISTSLGAIATQKGRSDNLLV